MLQEWIPGTCLFMTDWQKIIWPGCMKISWPLHCSNSTINCILTISYHHYHPPKLLQNPAAVAGSSQEAPWWGVKHSYLSKFASASIHRPNFNVQVRIKVSNLEQPLSVSKYWPNFGFMKMTKSQLLFFVIFCLLDNYCLHSRCK